MDDDTSTPKPDPNAVPNVNADDFFFGPPKTSAQAAWTGADKLLQTAADFVGKVASKLSGALSWLYKIFTDPTYKWASLGIAAGAIFLIAFALFGGFSNKSSLPKKALPPVLQLPAPPKLPTLKALDNSVEQNGKLLLSLGVSKGAVQTAENATLLEQGTAIVQSRPVAKAPRSAVLNDSPQSETIVTSPYLPSHYAGIQNLNARRYVQTLSQLQSSQSTLANSAVLHDAQASSR
jgi:hypothetical protein